MLYLNIKKIRESKNISQKQLSNLASISQSYLSELENNKFEKIEGVTLRMVYNIASALNVDISDIVKSKKRKPKDFL